MLGKGVIAGLSSATTILDVWMGQGDLRLMLNILDPQESVIFAAYRAGGTRRVTCGGHGKVDNNDLSKSILVWGTCEAAWTRLNTWILCLRGALGAPSEHGISFG